MLKSSVQRLLSLVAFLGIFTALFSCSNQIDFDSKNYLAYALNAGSDSGYGTIVVPGNDSRSLNLSEISYAEAVVYGTGIKNGSEPRTDNISVGSDGKGSFTITNVPTGSNRIVQVQAFDSEGNVLSDGTLRVVMDVSSGINTCPKITRETTKLANVFYFLNEMELNISGISLSEKSSIENVIDADVDLSKINTVAIATDFNTGRVPSLKTKADYIIGENEADKVVLHVKGYEYIHYWETDKDGTTVKMEADSEKGEGWYTITLDYNSINFLFKPNAGNDWSGQTGNMSRTAGIWYYEDGNWNGSASSDSIAPTVIWVRPSANSVLSEKTELFAIASDEGGIKKVEYYAGSTLLGETDGTCAFNWDSTEIDNGSYSLKAVAYDKAGNAKATSGISVTVKNDIALKAVISSSSSAIATIAKTFDGSSSKGDIASYLWNFGDGSTGTGAKPSHTYSAKGKYTVILTVKGTDGTEDSVTQTLNVSEKTDFQHRDFREETVYFMMTDRFADGDSTNNNIWGDEFLPAGKDIYEYDESKTGVLSYYHGGDFKGIINNLDYIADMGFTAIWITPSVKQSEGRFKNGLTGDKFYEASPFHGYWGYDFDQIDPHLHSSGKNSDGWDDYKAFIDACHAKGIRVMQDIVINHGNHSAAGISIWKDNPVQTIMDGKKWAWQTMDPYYDENNLYNGFYAYTDSWQCADLIDFGDHGEDGKDARQHIINVYKKYIDAGVDAFRIDTMAYITNEFAGEFADAMYNHAKELGNDYFYMIGESWCGRHDAVARHSKDTTDSLHMLDMHLSCLDGMGDMYKVFGGTDSIGAIYSNATGADKSFSCMTADEYTKTAMFVDNHDCYRRESTFSEAGYKNALNFIYLFRGVPIVYYGTEAMYSWNGTHPTTNKEDVCSRWMLGDVGINYVKQNKPAMYKHLKVLNELYHKSECIQKGAQDNVSINTVPAAFTRTWNGKTAAVLLNHQGSEGSYSFTGLSAGTYKLYTSSGDGVLNESTVSVSGSYSLKAPANGFAVLDPCQ